MSEPRRAGQRKNARFFSQPVDPVTGRRMNVTAGSQSELDSRLRRLTDVRDGLKFGEITMKEAAGRLRPTQGMGLRVVDVWKRYTSGLPEASAGVAQNAWTRVLGPFFGELSIWDLTEAKMRDWRRRCERATLQHGKKGYAPKTIRNAYQFLRAAIALAMRDGLVSEWPWGGFSVPNPTEPATERDALRDVGELVTLLECAAESDRRRRVQGDGVRLPILFLALTGLRQAEAAALSWSALELESAPAVLHVRKQASKGWHKTGAARPWQDPKMGQRRRQVLHPTVARELLAHRATLERDGRYEPDGPVFPSPKLHRVTGRWRRAGRVIMPGSLRAVVKLAGFPSSDAVWVPHGLRHSFARLELLAHGGDLRSVAARTGHKALDVLQGYLRQMARGDGASRIPELPAHVGPPALEAHGSRPEPAKLPPVPAAPATPAKARSWTALALEVVAKGENGTKPPSAVRARFRANYQAGYAAAKNAGKTPAECQAAGRRAKKAGAGAWGKALSRARASKLATERAT